MLFDANKKEEIKILYEYQKVISIADGRNK
jgi:hypothetical protein